MRDLRIIFMGTPDFAVPGLDLLVKNNYNVVAVITAPDKPKGRGQKLAASPVKKYAIENNIPVLQPTNLKSQEFIKDLQSYNANLQVVVAFRMLPEVVWAMPKYGTFNLHASLLPQYRGAAPINWVLINGEKETGVTTFFIKHEIDTGSIILQDKEPVYENDNAGSLHDRLMVKGADLVLKTVKKIEANQFQLTPQHTNEALRMAPKLSKEMCEIDWHKTAEEVYNFIRGLSPYPAAWTKINDLVYKIYEAEVLKNVNNDLKPGEYKTDNKTFLYFKTQDDLLSIKYLQKQGKKRMDIQSFLRGNEL